MKRFAGIALAGWLSACAGIESTPSKTLELPVGPRRQSVDMQAAADVLAVLAPGRSIDADAWDRLSLLAAALASHPDLAAARAGAAAARANAAVARVRPGPTFTLTAEYAFDAPESSPFLFSILSDLLLDRGERRAARIAESDIAARIAEFGAIDAAWAVRMQVRRSVDRCLASAEHYSRAVDLQALRQREFEAMRRRLDAGVAARKELEGVRASMALAGRVVGEAKSERHKADLDLASALGVAPAGIRCAVVSATDVTTLPLPAVSGADRETAILARTDILTAAADYDRAETALRAAVAGQYPEVRLGPGYTWERGLSKLPFSITLALPSDDRNRAAIEAAEADRLAAARRLEAAVASVGQQIDRAEADYRAALDALAVLQQDQVPTAAALAASAQRALSSGAIDRADWAAAQAGLAAVRIETTAAVAGLREALAALEDALRVPLTSPERDVFDRFNTLAVEDSL